MNRVPKRQLILSYVYRGRDSFGMAIYRVFLTDVDEGRKEIGKIGTTQKIALSKAPGKWFLVGQYHSPFDTMQAAGEELRRRWEAKQAQPLRAKEIAA